MSTVALRSNLSTLPELPDLSGSTRHGRAVCDCPAVALRPVGFGACFARLYVEKLEPARLACLVDSAVTKNDLRLSYSPLAALAALALAGRVWCGDAPTQLVGLPLVPRISPCRLLSWFMGSCYDLDGEASGVVLSCRTAHFSGPLCSAAAPAGLFLLVSPTPRSVMTAFRAAFFSTLTAHTIGLYTR